jgi:hypothetical protein
MHKVERPELVLCVDTWLGNGSITHTGFEKIKKRRTFLKIQC